MTTVIWAFLGVGVVLLAYSVWLDLRDTKNKNL
jgi:hypothetical protein